MTPTPLKYALSPSSAGVVQIKGDVSGEPTEGLFPGYSASGQDVWLEPTFARFYGPGLVLSAVGARCGKVFYAEDRWGVVANTTVLLPRPGNDARFLWYLTNNEEFWDRGVTAQPYVLTSQTLQRPVYLPRFEEQRRIADFLDDQVTRLNSARLLRERQLELAEDGIESAARNACIGRISSTPLRRHIKAIKTGATPSQEQSEAWSEEVALPWLTPEAISASTVEVGPARRWIRHQWAAKFPLFPAHSTLIVGIGNIGRVAYLTEASTGNQQLTALTPNSSVIPKFLTWAVRARRAELRATAPFTTLPIVNNEALKSLSLEIPNLAEQHRIVADLDQRQELNTRLQEEFTRWQLLVEERKQALITAAVIGQLDVTTARSVF